MMSNLSRGSRFVVDNYEGDWIPPSLFLGIRNIPPNRRALLSNTNVIYIDFNASIRETRLDMTQIGMTLSEDKKDVLYQGTVPGAYFLSGVEETHHSYFQQTHPEQAVGDTGSAVVTSTAEYDSIEDEFVALEAKISAAKFLELPPVTIQLLQARYDAAKLIRGD